MNEQPQSAHVHHRNASLFFCGPGATICHFLCGEWICLQIIKLLRFFLQKGERMVLPLSHAFIPKILGVNSFALMKSNSVDSILVMFHKTRRNINTLAYSFEVFNKCSLTSEFHISSHTFPLSLYQLGPTCGLGTPFSPKQFSI